MAARHKDDPRKTSSPLKVKVTDYSFQNYDDPCKCNVFGFHSTFSQSNLSSHVHDSGRVKGLIMPIPPKQIIYANRISRFNISNAVTVKL